MCSIWLAVAARFTLRDSMQTDQEFWQTCWLGVILVVEDHGANMCEYQILGEHTGYHVSSAAEGSPRFTSANVKDKSFLPCPVAVGPIFHIRLVG